MTVFNRERIRQDLTFNPDMSLHQAFMDLAYDAWDKGQAEHWSYQEMLSNARFVYGEIVEMAVMLGNYNYQVENGGHMQYFDNGYASLDKSNPYDDKDCGMVSRLITLMDEHGISKTESGQKVRELLCEFQVRTSCCDEPEYDDYDDLDTNYYNINKQWLETLESFLKGWMEKNENPL